MNNLDIDYVKDKTPEEVIIYFLNCCGISSDSLNNIEEIIIPRENLLNHDLYDKLFSYIPKIKSLLSSSTYTATQKNALNTQKWPLINLIRQILHKYNYQLIPKRICDGYTKDNKKKYKRFFQVKKLS